MISGLLFSLIWLATSEVDAKWISEIPNAPSRGFSKLFAIPTWISHIEDYDDDAFNATTIFTVIIIAVSTMYSLYHIFWIHLPSLPRSRRSVGPFNALILLYLISTFFASFTFSLMNAGRIWAAFGVFHNLFEIALLSHIMLRQKSLLERNFVSVCFAYLLTTMFAVIVLPWPLDALFFKFQGLATDFALSIDLGRLYYHNKGLHKKASVVTLVATTDDDCESVDDYTRECDQLVQQLQQQQQQKELNEDPNKKLKYQVMVPAHSNVAIIYIAATLHAIGNAFVTFTNHFYMWVIFQFIYGISFPMYAYYCIAEPNASRISWYKVDYAKEVLVMVSGIALAGVSIAVGIYNADIHH
ncbi:hypothetical protein [Parasitella parasitica]|uniref:Uncharacterized protein n=1 Tax=Parasitella parasitica TaxID=35722 RepID=A0A0B7N044_9FUNG|nr:hypothetical protein [Parasitella parasitica]